MTRRRELLIFGLTLVALVSGFFFESLIGGKVLSSADVLLASASFREVSPAGYEPMNRLLMDPTLQFEPWIEFNRRMLRTGRLPLWNSSSGCGAPHLANGQSAVFDPFQLIAYVGTVPEAFALMAAARLWFAGFGMFLLARAWGFGGWGRWFCGLTYPISGFLVVWLLYPVTNVAVWMPWVFLSTQSIWDRPSSRSLAGLALSVTGTLLGGHVQTAAHVLLATGAYVTWLTLQDRKVGRRIVLWSGGVALGISLAAIQIVPLAVYLTRSPVWGDRDQERVEPWKVVRPRLLEAFCTVMPSIYGSQRRGEPNLAKAVGADNQNESAGGYSGLATLVWLVPLAWANRRDQPRVRFLIGFTLFGFAAAFRLPIVDNLLRVIPVLKVTDNRRMTLWVAFGLVALGGFGLDRLASIRFIPWWRRWGAIWVVGSVDLIASAFAIHQFAADIHARALAHYAKAALATPGADRAEYQARAERQTEATLRFVPRYLIITGAEGLVLAGLLLGYRRNLVGERTARAILVGLTLAELIRFGFGLNPAIDRSADRPMTRLIADLRREVGRSGRIIGLGAEFPPNTLMRYGLLDARNYDSVETSRNLDWFRPIYDPKVAAQTSRREVTWDRIDKSRDRLKLAGVKAVVGPSKPPPHFDRVDRYGPVWVAWLDADPLITVDGAGELISRSGSDGRFEVEVEVVTDRSAKLILRETFDPGWVAEADGLVLKVLPYRQAFLSVSIPPGRHKVVVKYDPREVRVAWIVTGFAAIALVFALTGSLTFRSTRNVVPRLGRTQAFGLESDS